MPVSGEHKTVQARILKYAQEIGWTYVPREKPSGGAALIRTVQRRRSARVQRRSSSATCCTQGPRIQPEIQGG